jgi:glycosyltransferase involved in cell wall biosynthesis
MPPHSVAKKIKLVCFIGELELGGSERQLYLLLKHIDRDLFDCHVLVFNPSPGFVLNDWFMAIGVHVWQMPPNCQGVLPRIRYIYNLLRKIKPDIVHSWTAHDNPYAGLVGRLVGTPICLGSLRGSLSSPGFQGLPLPYRFLSLYSVSKLVVNCEATAKELIAKRYPVSKVAVTPNCVEILPTDLAASDLSSLGIRDRHQVVGIVSNLWKVKNHLMFVQGMAQVLSSYPHMRGLIAGQSDPDEPELPDEIASAIRDLELDGRVILAGFRSDVPALMQRLTVFCLTSTIEGMPNAILEAMAAARPVVATRVGGVPELVKDGVNGILVEPGDVQGFARAVKYLLENPELAEKMGLAGREIAAREFRCDWVAQQFTDLYCGMLAQKRGRFFSVEVCS